MIPSFSGGAARGGEIDAERRAAARRAQSEYLIFEQDYRKKMRIQSGLEMELRRLGMERDRLEIRIDEKQSELERLSRDLGILETEGKRLKKKVNLLS